MQMSSLQANLNFDQFEQKRWTKLGVNQQTVASKLLMVKETPSGRVYQQKVNMS